MTAQLTNDVSGMTFDMLINGQLVSGSRTLDVIDPATAQVFASCACASEAQLEQAIAAAKAAFPGWAATPIEQRKAIMLQMADAVDAEADTLARLLTCEQGKPLAEALGEVGGVSYFLRHYTQYDLPVEVIEDSESRHIAIHRAPLGVVAAIVPWNFPLVTAISKICSAMITGNTMVLKPAATTPVATLHLGRIVSAIIPAGVLNIVADQNDLGGILSSHPDISKIAFTGSTATGSKVMASASATLKRMTLELGGNDSGIVLDDCDPAEVSAKLFASAFGNNGQICIALKRLYVHETQYEAVCANLAELANNAVVGSGLNADTQLGPVQNRMQYDKLKALIEQTRTQGTIIAGGDCPDLPGYFINPTIVRDIADDAALVTDEQFGPVLPVMSYSNLDEVIARANNTCFGLGNSVWSADSARAAAVAMQLDSGSVWINKHGDIGPDTPFSGAKMSGVGVEMAEHGLMEFTQMKVINLGKNIAV
ncbi:MAG: aldehyde dehydrogenase family protein [Pseudomonadales bacterium]|jgi:acyl-CoA reductase-like NAD-dependent aldehyde dehydrogenase|nr:aldehyde dehydrogenase family protein [Pseudomonadales bacterium]MDP4753026.1 aldehyde dehydrogenase family protein [Porticoccaceae bacterium]MDP5051143.1 aldehyde dehydrogenase family protein [Porticoccaceae bacterium]|tara:strand:- start:182 stop:1627 length:1446 start_codon:yes stop_codon:yes gene_type:complete